MKIFLVLSLLFYVRLSASESAHPNIIFILADDLGWNDVSFHGSSQILTPNLDVLAYSGIILNNYYVMPLCTPSRSALMTGKHPIHNGMQHGVLYGGEPRGLPLNETILPQYLKRLGYSTHIVGKWHLGSYKKEYTPTYRGFDSHLGFWTGHHDYFDHTAMENGAWGLDIRRNMEVAWDLHGDYSTDIFTKEAEKIINNHNISNPLFLYFAHSAVHSANPYNPLPSPDNYVAKLSNITNYNRRRFAGVLTKMDESVGKVVQVLQKNNMLKNSIIIFSSDNGGPANGFNLNAASNWPLRGVKNTLWEGGVKAAGFLWSPLIREKQRVALQMMHISDWLPTLYHAAGGDVKDLSEIDGYNLWPSLSTNTDSPRKEILHNIDEKVGNSAITVGEWKFINGSTYHGAWDYWYGPNGRSFTYNIKTVLTCSAGKALSNISEIATESTIKSLRGKAEINCPKYKEDNVSATVCKPLNAPCLFNIEKDPCEKNNLAQEYPNILNDLQSRLDFWKKTAVPPGNLPLDPKGNPRYWQYTWTNFGDFI
ncbi:hypothetical protein RN001_003266 [Aquatica leii]|uniref:Sulfatase N-terminal domain-containing protein n=1 Tax=Aquatica leii TaxID=1421715 RepID=A0AAN7SSZ9_9COLE|nr:hypothetical protein RN001_003266 [Aquatica leii]